MNCRLQQLMRMKLSSYLCWSKLTLTTVFSGKMKTTYCLPLFHPDLDSSWKFFNLCYITNISHKNTIPSIQFVVCNISQLSLRKPVRQLYITVQSSFRKLSNSKSVFSFLGLNLYGNSATTCSLILYLSLQLVYKNTPIIAKWQNTKKFLNLWIFLV